MSFFWKISLILLLVATYTAKAQRNPGRQLAKATEAYHARAYHRAESLATKELKKSPNNLSLLLLLADVYLDTGRIDSELEMLLQAAAIEKAPTMVNLRVAQAFFKTMRYSEAERWASKFLTEPMEGRTQESARRLIAAAQFAKQSVAIGTNITLEPAGAGINTAHDEYWPALTLNGSTMLFTRRIKSGTYAQEDLFISQLDGAGWGIAKPISELNSALNEGAATIAADGTLLFFTLCNHPNGMGSCDIWFSRLTAAGWSNPRNAGPGINTAAWEGQPSVTATADRLYFSSSRQGGQGGRDLWSIPLKGWDAGGMPIWGVAKNLGNTINTPGDEISPFIHFNGIDLFFSSDHHPGLGGLDLFRSTINLEGRFGVPTNLGYPINSSGNEQGLVIDHTGTKAYIASNRNEMDPMDIYSFTLPESIRPQAVSYVTGTVTNKKTRETLRASLFLQNLSTSEAESTALQTNHHGVFIAALSPGKEYLMILHETGFLFHSERIWVPETSQLPYTRNIELSPIEVGQVTNLRHIYFQTDRWELLPVSEPELEFLFQLLQQNPTLEAEIQGHTDNSGSENHNLILSEKRATSVADYLTLKGIDVERLTIRGYGDTQPIAPNDTEESRSLNRRTAIKIIGF